MRDADGVEGASLAREHIPPQECLNVSDQRGGSTVRALSLGLQGRGADRTGAVTLTQLHSPQYVWYVIGLLTTVNVINYMDRTVLSVLMPLIKADLNLTDGQLGLLVGFAFFLFYAICGIPIACWADRGVRTNIIAITLSVWSVMTALSGVAQNFWHLLAVRIGLGAGEAGCIPSAQSIIADYVAVNRRAGVYAIHTFGQVGGMVVGLILGGWLGEMIGWRWTFVVLGLPGVLLAMIVKLTLREPARGSSDGAVAGQSVNPSLRETIKALWECRSYRLIVSCFVVSGFTTAGLMQWWPSFYSRVFGIGLSSVGINLGLAIGTGSAIGTLTGGFLANKAQQQNVKLPLLVGAAAIALSMLTALGSLFVSSSTSSMGLVSMTALLWGVPIGAMTAALYTVTNPRMRATAGALTIFCIAVLGFGPGPFCVGLLSDHLSAAFDVQALRYALILPIAMLALMASGLYSLARILPQDLRAAGVAPN